MNNSDLAYKNLLEKKVLKLQKDISELEKRNKGIRLTNDYTTELIERKKLEVAKIQEALKDYTERVELGVVGSAVVEKFDEFAAYDSEKRQIAADKIKELNELKSRLTTVRAKAKIDKKIKHQQKVIERLQKKDNFISGVQKVVMYPKHRKEMKKQQLLSKQESKVLVSENSYNDLVEMQAMLDPEHSVIDRLRNNIFEMKKSHYLRKRDRAAEILEKMQTCKHSIQMRGAAPIVISKRLKDKFTGKLNQDRMLLENAQKNIQNQDMTLAVAK